MKPFLLFLFLIGSPIAFAQHIYSGSIHALDTKETIPSAQLRLKGSNRIYLSNAYGEFRFSVPEDSLTIEVSAIGFVSKTLALKASTGHVTIILQPAINHLQEVMVSTGYQQKPKDRLTGSFSSINTENLNKQVGSDILSRLEATANGLAVDRGTNSGGRINIRGLSSIIGPKEVLIVLDNFPYEGEISNINPNDVESITLLKDAAAASIWGAKAGNGVIVITTKKGRYNQPLSIDLNSFVSSAEKPDLSYLKQMSSSDFIDVEQFLFAKNYYNSQISSSSRPVLSPVVELLVKRRTANAAEAAIIDQRIEGYRSVDIRDQFNKYLYQRSFNQQYALSLKGGTDKMTWLASTGLDYTISNSDAVGKRNNFRFSNSWRPVKGLQISSGIYYTRSNNESGKPGYGEITSKNEIYIFPYARLADENGNALAVPKNWRQSYLESLGQTQLADWNYYPLEDYKDASSTQLRNDILVNAEVEYQLFKGFTAGIKFSQEQQLEDQTSTYTADSYMARNMVNSFALANGTSITFNVPKGGILDQTNAELNARNLRAQLNYNREWQKHEFSVLAGWESRRLNTSSTSSRQYGYNTETLSHGTVDLTRQFPNYITGGNAFIPDNNSVGERNTNFLSWFANGSYTFQKKYSLSLSGRRDASNLFGLKTNDQWNPFWSAGLAWLISGEDFYQAALLPYLKLRGSYGFSGNINPNMVAATTINYMGTSPYTQTPFAMVSNYYNSELRWEKSGILNIGLDFGSKGSRITGSVEFYRKKGRDLFGPALMDYTGGTGAIINKNVASMKGKGLDVELRSLNIDRRFKWSSYVNFSLAKDEVTDYYLNSQQGSSFVGTSTSARISGMEGKPVYSIFSYRWAGLDPATGEPRGYLNNEVSTNYSSITGTGTTINDLRYHGSAVPTVFGSFGNTLRYRKFALDFAFSFKGGYYFRRESVNYSNLFSNWVAHSDYSKRWQKPGDELVTDVPVLSYPASTAKSNFYAGSEVLVERGDLVRFQYLNLSWDIKPNSFRNLPFKGLTIYANASNLGLIWKANNKGIDPDYAYGMNRTTPPQVYAFGLRTSLK